MVLSPLFHALFIVSAALWAVYAGRGGGWTFAGVYVLFCATVAGRAVAASAWVAQGRPDVERDLGLEHARWLARHAVYFRFPRAARAASGVCSLAALLSSAVALVLAVRGFWNHSLWWQVLPALASSVVSGMLAARLHPAHIIAEGERKNPGEWVLEKALHTQLESYLEVRRRVAAEGGQVLKAKGSQEAGARREESPTRMTGVEAIRARELTLKWLRYFGQLSFASTRALTAAAQAVLDGERVEEALGRLRPEVSPARVEQFRSVFSEAEALCACAAGLASVRAEAEAVRLLMHHGFDGPTATALVESAGAAYAEEERQRRAVRAS